MGAVDTTYTFTATDTITSAKMNNIIDQTTMTSSAIIGTTLEVASGQLKVRAQGITSNELASEAVTQAKLGANVAGNGPAFVSGIAAQQNIGTGSLDTKIILTETSDTNNNFASSTFTATVAGHYLFSGAIQVLPLAGNTYLSGHSTIYKNGSRFVLGQYNASSTGNIISPVSCIIRLNVNDTVEFYSTTFATTAGCYIPNLIETTYFTGCLIRSA
jgi:hypothetical protein